MPMIKRISWVDCKLDLERVGALCDAEFIDGTAEEDPIRAEMLNSIIPILRTVRRITHNDHRDYLPLEAYRMICAARDIIAAVRDRRERAAQIAAQKEPAVQ